ncbi:hypothetical protein SAMN06265795_12845 [Noviherbaspirillum humi]|uniref:Uncharacterized protein n=1 Tax=Noviherbaspirillum humi TaxID=1688639 RepID=A0A239LZD7_9BURK|nr:hypothetical protein [Noviherbaspirillum humi]SNT35821.1 hypothetical protein SAMN06265795_12845 [Noviherbaspirillum humi]
MATAVTVGQGAGMPVSVNPAGPVISSAESVRARSGRQVNGMQIASSSEVLDGEQLRGLAIGLWDLLMEVKNTAVAGAVGLLTWDQWKNLVQVANLGKSPTAKAMGDFLLNTYFFQNDPPVLDDKGRQTKYRGQVVYQNGQKFYVRGGTDPLTGWTLKQFVDTKEIANARRNLVRQWHESGSGSGGSVPSGPLPNPSGCLLRSEIHPENSETFTVIGIGKNVSGGPVKVDARVWWHKDNNEGKTADEWLHAEGSYEIPLMVNHMRPGARIKFEVRCDNSEDANGTLITDVEKPPK